MTDEFLINILKQYREKPTLINEIETVEEAAWLDEALGMAIKALEQESKTGHWIERIERDDWDDSEEVWYECNQCHLVSERASNYCPNCGAKMAESEVQE